MMDRIHQPIIAAYREEIDAKTFLSLNIFVGMRMLVQISHDRKKRCLIPMKTAPGMKAYIRKA